VAEDESAIGVSVDPLEGKLRAMTRGLTGEDREEIIRFVEYLRHKNSSNPAGQ
jgi:hypothetical protein